LESKEDGDTDDKNGEICIIIDVVETSSKPRAKAFKYLRRAMGIISVVPPRFKE
jgi:hypothetical protein